MTEYSKKSNIGDLEVVLWFDYEPPDPRDGLYPSADATVVLNEVQVGEVYLNIELEDIFQDSLIKRLERECLEWAAEHERDEYYE